MNCCPLENFEQFLNTNVMLSDLMGTDYTDKLEWPMRMEMEETSNCYENEPVYKEEQETFEQTR